MRYGLKGDLKDIVLVLLAGMIILIFQLVVWWFMGDIILTVLDWTSCEVDKTLFTTLWWSIGFSLIIAAEVRKKDE